MVLYQRIDSFRSKLCLVLVVFDLAVWRLSSLAVFGHLATFDFGCFRPFPAADPEFRYGGEAVGSDHKSSNKQKIYYEQTLTIYKLLIFVLSSKIIRNMSYGSQM